MKLTKNFYYSEFLSPGEDSIPDKEFDNILELAENLQIIRDYIKSPIHINSAYRTPEHNKDVGGVKNSQHIKGKAADLVSKNYTSLKLYKIIRYLMNTGKIKVGGLGLYNGFVHYDIRGYKARWNKSKYFVYRNR